MSKLKASKPETAEKVIREIKGSHPVMDAYAFDGMGMLQIIGAYPNGDTVDVQTIASEDQCVLILVLGQNVMDGQRGFAHFTATHLGG